MPSPTGWSPYKTTPLSGNNSIDSLLYGTNWVSGALTYSYPTTGSLWSTSPTSGYGPSTGTGEPWTVWYDTSSTSDKTYTVQILQQWANVANLTFTAVPDTPTSVGDIRFAYSYLTSHDTAQAWVADFPGPYASAADIWFNALGSSSTKEFKPGTYEGFAVLHELGHALGLKHPFQPSSMVGAVLPDSFDSQSYSVMSYSASTNSLAADASFYPTTPMLLDIQAIQYIYGANYSYNSGNSTYTYSDAINYRETIWDGGGIDSLNYVGSRNATIDLREGHGSKIGNLIYTLSATGAILGTLNNVWIAYGVTIENASGGSGNDTLTGNDANNSLDGGAGNDIMYGGTGNDIFDWNASARGGNDTFYGGLGDDTFVLDSALDRVIENPGEGTDTVWVNFSDSLANLLNVENLRAFGSTGLTLTGDAGNNLVSGSTGNDIIEGGAGTDTVWYAGVRASYAIAWITGGVTITSAADGIDTLKNVEFARFSNQTISLAPPISGGPGNDTLTGTTGADVIYGNGGDDRIVGMGGGDSIYGGSGIDTVVFAYDSGDYLVSKSPTTGSYEVISKTGTIDFVDADVEKMEFRNITADANSYKYYGTTDPVLAGSVSSVYRFFNTIDNAFFYTNSVAERDTVLANSDVSHNNVGEWPYVYQGSSFEAAHTYAGAVPLERFYNTVTHHHFFTSSATEAATVKANSASGAWPFVYEGVSFNVYASDPTPNSVGQEIAVERFYSAALNRHWFTADQTEIAQIRLTGLWADEGIGFWGEKPGA